mmetsp:Transcript_107056/g.160032  ORF Transcript_107056/g.160032 Transcript_107056/m.160032 type:complete len:123 (+) Transcript_107056:495-863(+)
MRRRRRISSSLFTSHLPNTRQLRLVGTSRSLMRRHYQSPRIVRHCHRPDDRILVLDVFQSHRRLVMANTQRVAGGMDIVDRTAAVIGIVAGDGASVDMGCETDGIEFANVDGTTVGSDGTKR